MHARPVCLVTGAARRVGRVIALEMASHGFDVAVHYRQSREQALALVAEIAALGAKAQAFGADLSQERGCRTLAATVVSWLGRLDAVVNNASAFEPDDANSFSHRAMELHWRANTAPAVLLSQALHEHLRARGATGCVINLLDQKLWNPNPDYFSYTLSKAALQAATTMLAQAYAPVLRVCGVAPGLTLASQAMNAQQFDAAQRLNPLQRASTPQDVARAVRFLIESPAITGTNLLVDGGQHLTGQARDVLYLTQDEHAKPSATP
jgi:NAD(P)-dependent dehydrogenase (short-subunit alcohol dehydrogenase family)